MDRSSGGSDETPFVRTLAGAAGVPGSLVVTDQSGTVFTLGERAGGSAAGNVYEAICGEYTQPIVVKLFPGAAGVGEAALEQFTREALLTSEAGRGPTNVGRVLQAGRLDNGLPFLVAERLRGETLKELLARGGGVSAGAALQVLRGVGAALAEAHALGIVHGQVRPDNIFLVVAQRAGGADQAGAVKLLDFGVAALTEAPAVPDPRTDVSALAVVARTLLAALPAGRSPAVEAVLRVATLADPEQRFGSVTLFLNALEEAIAGAAMLGAGARRARLPTSPLLEDQVRDHEPPSDPALRVSGTPTRSGHVQAPAPPPAPMSVTRQFFDEGDRLSEEAALAQIAGADVSQSSLNIPRHRRGRAALVLGGLALAAVLAAGIHFRPWSAFWTAAATGRPTAGGAVAPALAPSAPAAPAAPAVAAAPAPGSVPAAAAPVGSDTPSAAPGSPAAVVAAPTTVAGAPLPAVPKAATPSPPVAASAVIAEPPASAGPRRARLPDPSPPAPATTEDDRQPAGGVVGAASSAAAAPRAGRREPLRGYVWSPRDRRLVPAARAGALVPASAAWPPPLTDGASPSGLAPPPTLPPLPKVASPDPLPPAAERSVGEIEIAPAPLPDPVPAPRP